MNNIPKIIHYCWFGPKSIPEMELICIESWHKFFPDYKFMIWNEQTFDVRSEQFTHEAYESGKYAFVSDFVRVKVLYEYGGIYLDTDIEILKRFDSIFDYYNFICGFETRKQIGTALIACSKGNIVISELYEFYKGRSFKTKYGENVIANVGFLTSVLQERGLTLGGSHQTLDDIFVANREVFYPKRLSTNEFKSTEETIAIHRCSNSWMTQSQKKRGNSVVWVKIFRPILVVVKRIVKDVLGEERMLNIEILIRKFLR